MIRVAIFVLAFGATSAFAQPANRDADARGAAAEGTARFNKYEYKGSIEKFTEAYELNHDPAYLFNIAQAYRLDGDCVKAAEYYGKFLEQVPHPPNEEKIRGWYSSQSECAKARAANPQDTDQKQQQQQQQPPPPPPRQEEPSGSGRLGLVIALAGTSAAALAVGGFFVWDAAYLEKQRDSKLAGCTLANPCSSAEINDYDRRGSRANTIAAVGFAVGGVALAASATLYLLSRSSDNEAPVAIVPLQGGALVARSFTW